ncbi:multidrug resistance-associated protein 1 isoform X3 [Culicoides brevitarsis]|uniref:multidrug resistance-associated protein 1 isoform X3 n=1 Tax=Culicoides brevitarsis TaxID=469753 RepID=UPI00307C5C0A
MDEFCGSEFWNTTLIWHSDVPDFTICFEQTIFTWVPCIFLWLLLPLELFYMKNSPTKNIPYSFWNVSKLVLSAAIVILTCIDLGLAIKYNDADERIIFPVHFYTPIIKIVTIILSMCLVYYNKVNGVRTSGTLFLFWLFVTIFSIPRVITESRRLEHRQTEQIEDSWAEYQFVSFCIFFALSCAIFLLNCFADAEPRESIFEKQEKPCPEMRSSFLSRILFSWFDGLALLGYKKPLETKDLWDMRYEDSSSVVSPAFHKHWNKLIGKANAKPVTTTKATYSKEKESAEKVELSAENKQKTNASILMPLIKAFGGTFLMGSSLKFLQDILTFVNPQLLSLSITFVTSDEPMWKGIAYAVSLFVVASLQTLLLGQYFNRMMLVGLRIRTALIAAIYRKSLVISNAARKESTVGEIVNLMAVDAQRFMDLTTYINMLWSAPLQIGLALFFLWRILGPSVLAGLGVMIILIPVNGFIANKIKVLQIKQMQNKDERVKLMNEVLNGMKVLKLYAWEPSFEKQILNIREKEIKVLKQAAYLNAGTSFIWSCAPFLVSLVTFATFVMVDENNVLTASIAFTSLSLFNILRFPLSMLPMLISSLVQTSVSVTRINKFMNAEELDPDNVQTDESEPCALVIENGTFQWDTEETTLKNINMKVEKNQLVAVVGTVGSGKSSLLSAYLGEMDRISGRVNRKGQVAYVPQQAWIQNASLRDNILFSKPFDKKRYDRVVEACALKPDLEMLPGGDQTEIGEKGINLSGGQKQRISLARAVYQDADIYFLDDPLSAVDSHVGKHIFEQVIGPKGILSGKTRVLVTHGITYLPQVDNIFVMQMGEITESGTYKELLDKKGQFSEFLLQHLQNANEDEEDLEQIKQQLQHDIGDKDLKAKLERAISSSRTRSDSTSEDSRKLSRQDSQNSVENGVVKRKSSTPEKKVAEDDDDEKKDKLIEAEKAETGKVKWDVYKHYLKSIGWGLALATILLNVIFQGFSIGSNIWLSKWSTDERANETKWRNIYLGGYGAFGVGQAIIAYGTDMLPRVAQLNAAKKMHEFLVSNLLRVPIRFHETVPTGRIISRVSKDIETLDYTLPESMFWVMNCFWEVIATVTVISISTPIFMSVILPIGIIYFFVQRFYVATSRQLKRLESVSRSPVYSHFGESITGVSTIRAYNVQDRFIRESEKKVDFNQICYFPSIIANRWLAIRLEMVGNFIIFFAALFAVLGRDSSDPLRAGLVGLSLSYALQITQTLNWLVRMTSDVETNIVAVERIKEYGEVKQEAAWEVANHNVPRDWPEHGEVAFDNYEVRYREGLDLVLKGITFTVKGGEKVGIVGRTGAGKSSLTLSLFRIIEAAGGKIMIDGQDISKMGLHTLRQRLTIIPQDPVLFSGTLRMNLDPFEQSSDDDLWRALENAHLKSFVKGLAAGLNHEITEGGENLSVGQRQLVCLARALLRKTKVLILDEATAAVDLETDDLIQRTIRTEFKDCTILTIAHRLNTIMDSDRVIVLDQGKMVEFAPPEDLLKHKKSIFYGMAKDAGLAN